MHCTICAQYSANTIDVDSRIPNIEIVSIVK